MLDPSWFEALDKEWGLHTVDRFASEKTKQLPRFSSKYLNPGCESIDAFTVSWSNENNWLFPPPYLIPRVLRHMQVGHERGTLIIPFWPSAPWWPPLVDKNGIWKTFVIGSLNIPVYNGIFIPGSLSSSQFADGSPSYQVWALRIAYS